MAVVKAYLRDRIWARAGKKCERCATPIVRKKSGQHNGSIHHRRPRRMQGPDWLSNLVLLCIGCHVEIHKNESQAALDGWIVWTDPEFTPVKIFGKSWVLLTPHDTYEYLIESEALKLLEWTEGIEAPSKRDLVPA